MFYRVLYYHLFATTALCCLLFISQAANLQTSGLSHLNLLSSSSSRLLATCSYTCANGGVCSSSVDKCNCHNGFFGNDCSVKATGLANNDAENVGIESGDWAYFYYSLGEDKEVKFSIDYTISPIKAALIFSDSSYDLPPTSTNSYSFMNSPSSRNWQITLSKKEVKQHIGQDVLIGFYNPNSAKNFIKIKASTSGSNVLTIVLIVIGVLSVILNIIGCVYYIKYKMRRELLAALREQAAREERANFAHNLHTHFGNIRIQNFSDNPNRSQNGHEGVVDLDASLTQEDLNMYFPQKQFETLKTPFGQAECPICLEDFPKDSMCRQLYCEHIFHTNCIQFWLAKHKACPNCKKSMTRMAIGDFYEKKRNKEANEKYDEEKRAMNQPEPEEAEAENQPNEENNNVVIDIGQALRIVDNNPNNELNVEEEEKNNQSHSQTQNVLGNINDEEEPRAPERLEATHLEVVHLSADKKDEEPDMIENVIQE